MTFLSVIALTPEGRIAKHEEFDTVEEADAHVLEFHGLFSVPMPNVPSHSWRFNAVEKTVRIDLRPPRPPEPESDVLLALRDLADAAGPDAVAKLEARMGARRT